MIDCLAATGIDVVVPTILGAALVVLGAAAMLLLRRRDARRWGSTLAVVLVLGLGVAALSTGGTAGPASAAGAAVPSSADGCVTGAATSTPTPAPTPPSVQADQEVTFQSAGVTYHASYRAPAEGRTAVAAAVIISGTGAIDRNGDGAGLDIGVYRWIADRLSEEGIASIRYDKLGTGATGLGPYTDDPSALLSVSYDQVRVQPARDALSFLAAQPGIDPGKLIVLGHSEGGTTALALYADPGSGPSPAGLALVEPGYTAFLDIISPQLSSQIHAGVDAGLITPPDAAALNAWMADGIAEIRTGTPPYPAPGPVPLPGAIDYTALLQSTIESNIYGSDPAQTVVSHAYRTLYGKQVDAIDPQAIAATVTVPTLVTCGTKDFNTPCGDGSYGSGVVALASDFAPGIAHFAELPDTVHILRDVGADNPEGVAAQLAYPYSQAAAAELRAYFARFAG